MHHLEDGKGIMEQHLSFKCASLFWYNSSINVDLNLDV